LMTQRRLQRGDSARSEAGLAAIERYAREARCRQQMLCGHFTGRDDHAACGSCDVCVDPGAIEAPPVTRPRARKLVERKPRPARPSTGRIGLGRELDAYRKRRARELKWKAYMVFQRNVILAIEQQRPSSTEALARIPGLGPSRIARFGDDL